MSSQSTNNATSNATTNTTTTTTVTSSNPKQRRSNKPLMEKRRRERINKSLNALKELVLKAEQKDVSKFNKLEKADILEMTVKHVRGLHENSSTTPCRPDDCCIKYKEGYDRCISEICSYLGILNHADQETLSGAVRHLKSLAEVISKESRCPHVSVRGESKVKAVIDTSVFRSGIMRLESAEEDRISSPLLSQNSGLLGDKENIVHSRLVNTDCQSYKLDLMVHNNSHPFPPSPPDSSRCSSSPDSLRGSPRNFLEQGAPTHGLDKQIASYQYVVTKIIDPKNSPQFPKEQEGKPLNLTVSSHYSRQDESSYSPHPVYEKNSPAAQASSPSPNVFVKREPLSPPSYPSSLFTTTQPGKFGNAERLGNLNLNGSQSGNAFLLEAGGPSREHSFKCEGRPTPYPKKEVAKRYQNQNLRHVNEIHHGNGLQVVSIASHWRPW